MKGPQWLGPVLGYLTLPLAYSIVCILAFTLAYKLTGVEKHFELTKDQEKSPWFASFYIACMAQSNAMGDATPKTQTGRKLFLTNTILGWFWFLALVNLLQSSLPIKL